MRKFGLPISVLALLVGCATNHYLVGQYRNVTGYSIKPTYRTASGIYVDDRKNELYPRLVDRMVAEVEVCIAALPPKWTTAEMVEGNCTVADVPRSIRRDWITVAVPPDWYVSSCSQEQEFKCDINPRLCDQKPETVEMPCPCACRATIQDGAVVTAPNMKLFKAELARLVTGCNNVWFGPLNECVHTPAYPLVDPPPS